MEIVVKFYHDDCDKNLLEVQLKTLPSLISTDNVSFKDILACTRKLSPGVRQLISEVIKLQKLILVMPATNAVSERSFSAMRRLFTYLRTNMLQSRLNNMMVLHVHKEKTDSLPLVEIANEFVDWSGHRINIFGKFSDLDLRRGNAPVKSRGISVNLN